MQVQITPKSPITVRDQQRNVFHVEQIGGDVNISGGAININPTHWPVRDELMRMAGRDIFYIAPNEVEEDTELKELFSMIKAKVESIVQARLDTINLSVNKTN